MTMEETSESLLLHRQSTQRKRVKFNRMYDPHVTHLTNGTEDQEVIPENETSTKNNSRPTIHWGPVVDGDVNGKEEINTETDHFDALFARSNASPPSHPRCYSSCSPSTIPSLLTANTPTHLTAKSQPLLSASPSSKHRQSNDHSSDTNPSSPRTSQQSNPPSARTKRKNFSLTHAAQTFLQASNSQNEQLEPLARSCSYKRPQSIKKYRQKKKEKEKEKEQQQQSLSPYKHSTITTSQNNQLPYMATSDSSRKSVTATTPRISAADLMSTDDPQDQWSSPKPRRSERLGSLPLDQLQLPPDGDQEIYLVRQFNTTSKGFVNRGDSFKRSIKRSGSTSRRSSFRANANAPTNERTSSPEHDNSPSSAKDLRTSINSLTNSSGINLNGILDTHFIDNNITISPSTPQPDQSENDEDEDEDEDNPVVERIQTEDGRLQDIHVYQVYLLGMSGTGKCSLMRQFKTTEYRGIYDYSSSVDEDPDNTVSIMLDGIESRLHIITFDIDQAKSTITGDAYVIVYSITDRQSFQTAVQLIKNVRENELINNNHSPLKRNIPIILVGNKSDLVRKRSVTKDLARHAAFKYNCKFVETSAAINDKVDDLLAGTLKQIRINEQMRTEQKRRLTVTNGSIDTNDSETPILTNTSSRKSSVYHRNSINVFSKFFNVFRKKPSKLPADVENLNTTN